MGPHYLFGGLMGQGTNQELEGGRELDYLAQKDTYLGSMLRRIISAVNTTAKNASVSAIGLFPTPPKVDSIQVQGTFSANTNTVITPSEILHWTLTHNQQVHKGVRYFTEIDNSPNFLQPHVYDHGTSRTGFLPLPTMDGNGATQIYYMRSYVQYHGSDPAEPTVLGGLSNATKIVMTGSSKMSLLSSTGSGTAQPTGTQGAKGLGEVLTRPAPTAKRSVVQHS
jgi:hypothetical protein